MSSLAITDALLCVCAAWLATRRDLPAGWRLACGVIAAAALLGVLRFSGVYPLPSWHRLFSIWVGSAALPLLAVCVVWPRSHVARETRFALIFLGLAALLGLAVSGLAGLRAYDQAVGVISMLAMLWALRKAGAGWSLVGMLCMVAGSALFAAKVSLAPWLQPGDALHIGMALGLVMLAASRPQVPATA